MGFMIHPRYGIILSSSWAYSEWKCIQYLSPIQTSNFSLTSFLTSFFSRVYDEQFFPDGRTHEQVSWLKSWHDHTIQTSVPGTDMDIDYWITHLRYSVYLYYYTIIGRGRAKYRDLSVANRSLICRCRINHDILRRTRKDSTMFLKIYAVI